MSENVAASSVPIEGAGNGPGLEDSSNAPDLQHPSRGVRGTNSPSAAPHSAAEPTSPATPQSAADSPSTSAAPNGLDSPKGADALNGADSASTASSSHGATSSRGVSAFGDSSLDDCAGLIGHFTIDRDEALRVADLFKVLGDPTRVLILQALIQGGELCVHHLAESVEMSQSAVSHHLRLLRNFGLIRYRRSGREVYYRPDDEHVERLIGVCVEHIRHAGT